MKATAFTRHVYAVQHYVRHTAARYEALMKPGIVTHPICCFGNVETAKVVTVGVNPSWSEFEEGRWPEEIDHVDLAERCITYFDGTMNPKAHPWFGPWREALGHVGCGYGNESAVHLDLSPRPTRFMSDLKEQWEHELFLEMLRQDLWCFFATLELCKNAKVLLIAGTVTGRYYINEFLQREVLDYGYTLDRPFYRRAHPGQGKVCWHWLSGQVAALPVFFCSSSPSDPNKKLLPQRIKEKEGEISTKLQSAG